MVKETVECPETKLKSVASIKTRTFVFMLMSFIGRSLCTLFLIKFTVINEKAALNAVNKEMIAAVFKP